MRRAGLGSARKVIAIAKVIRAFELLQDGGLTTGRVAGYVGFTSVRPLSRLVHAVTDAPIHDLRGQAAFNRLVT